MSASTIACGVCKQNGTITTYNLDINGNSALTGQWVVNADLMLLNGYFCLQPLSLLFLTLFFRVLSGDSLFINVVQYFAVNNRSTISVDNGGYGPASGPGKGQSGKGIHTRLYWKRLFH